MSLAVADPSPSTSNSPTADAASPARSPAITRPVVAGDMPAIRDLHARVFGPGRFARAAYRVREGTADASALCRLVQIDGRPIAALRMTEILIGGREGGLLLGPLAVEPDYAGQGYGKGLVGEVIELARAAGFELIVLVGNLSYYGRFGFVTVPHGQIWLPGPADPARILEVELQPGGLVGMHGVVSAAPRAFGPLPA